MLSQKQKLVAILEQRTYTIEELSNITGLPQMAIKVMLEDIDNVCEKEKGFYLPGKQTGSIIGMCSMIFGFLILIVLGWL